MEDFLKELQEFVYPEGWDDTSNSSKNHIEPWNKGKKGLQKNPTLAERNRNKVWTEEEKEKIKAGGRKNKGRKRPDLVERNKQRKGLNIPRDENGRFV